MPKHVSFYNQHEKDKLFNRVSNFIETRDLNPLCFTVNSQWIRNNMNIFGKEMLSTIITGYIKSSNYKSIVFEKYDTNNIISDTHNDKLHNIIKIYKFLRSKPSRYNVPISATFNYSINEWNLHPGATRIAVLEYIKVNKITLILFDGHEKLNHLPNHRNLRDMEFSEFQDMYSKVRGRIIQYKEFSNRFEISEDHRLVEHFTNDMRYRVDVYENRILVNKVVCFEKDSENLWVPILENIRQ